MSIPVIHHWLAGDSWNSERLNEVKDQIDWLRNPPMIHLRRRAVQSIPSTTWTKVAFDTLVNSYDPYGMQDGSEAAKINITEPGWYSCEIYSAWQSFGSVDARVIMGLYKNDFGASGTNSIMLRNDKGTQPSLSTNIVMRAEATFFFNVGDFIYLGVYNDDSAAAHSLANTSDAESTGIRIRWVSN